MIAGNHAPTWHQLSPLSRLLNVLAPAVAAGGVTAAGRSPAECAWVVTATGLVCWWSGLEKYPLHLMPFARLVARIGRALVAATLAVAPVDLIFGSSPRRAFVTIAAAGLAAAIIAVLEALLRPANVRVGVVGERSFAQMLAHQFHDGGARGFVFITSCPPDTPVDEFKSMIRAKKIDLVVIENRLLHAEEMEEIVDWCVDLRVRLTDTATLYERILGHVPVAVIRSAWFRTMLDPMRPPTRDWLWRARDIVASVVLLILVAPVMAATVASVALAAGRPILFRQRRVGREGREFELLKFRTMRGGDDSGARWSPADDPRVYRLGAWLRRHHLDELPQLINVLRGEMTLVGPRPEQQEIVHALELEIPFYSRRHLVTPGITGWAQVKCGYAGSMLGSSWKIGHDLFYLSRRSLLFDALIMIETLPVLVTDRQYGRVAPDPHFLLSIEPAGNA